MGNSFSKNKRVKRNSVWKFKIAKLVFTDPNGKKHETKFKAGRWDEEYPIDVKGAPFVVNVKQSASVRYNSSYTDYALNFEQGGYVYIMDLWCKSRPLKKKEVRRAKKKKFIRYDIFKVITPKGLKYSFRLSCTYINDDIK